METKLKIVTIIGARPQFIKAATVSRSLADKSEITEVIVHTGQHYDANMSDIFFEQMHIPKPIYNLGIGGGSHGAMTGRQLEKIEEVLSEQEPDWVLVYGDTNSTLAGALAAAKLHIPVAHVESGLRSYNRKMPEEINRVVTDHLSTLLFCPTQHAVKNLGAEGITAGVHHVGDVMFDATLAFGALAEKQSNIMRSLNLTKGSFRLATVHRAENTEDVGRLRSIVDALSELASPDAPVVLPLHPRTASCLSKFGLYSLVSSNPSMKVIEPVPFLDMLSLQMNAKVILTDSGGIQKEAYFQRVPCVTLRDETEWVETVEAGWNTLVSADKGRIVAAALKFSECDAPRINDFGEGAAAKEIIEILIGTEVPRGI
jgi:UDP-GlcNAc3NAcA epimerase